MSPSRAPSPNGVSVSSKSDVERTPGERPASRDEFAHLELLAEWLDRRWLDPLAGLFLPGLGGSLGSIVGLYGVFVAFSARVHPVVLARMLLNLALDAGLGAVPVLGWLMDFFYMAHVRNLRLLRRRQEHNGPTIADWLIVGVAFLLFVLALALPVLLLSLLLAWIMGAL